MAPTNEAFAQLPPNLLQFLLDPANKADLVRVLTYHVIGSKILAADLTNGEELLTVEGGHQRVTLYNKQVFINFAEVVAADNFASNGTRAAPPPPPALMTRVQVWSTSSTAFYSLVLEIRDLQLLRRLRARSKARPIAPELFLTYLMTRLVLTELVPSHGLFEQRLVENKSGDGGGDDAEVDEQRGDVHDDVPAARYELQRDACVRNDADARLTCLLWECPCG